MPKAITLPQGDDLQDFRDHFGLYYLAVNPGYKYVKFQQERIVPALEAVERGEIRRLAILMPPGHAKSDLATRAFLPWYLGRHPTENAMVCSYSANLASDDFGARIKRRMESDLHCAIFPRSKITRESRGKTQMTTESGGIFYSVGFSGGLTGKRLDCFPAGTMITTEKGSLDIAVLAGMTNPPRVLGFDHTRKQAQWKRIQAARKVYSNDLVEITTVANRRIRCTADHRIYTANGYRQAQVLQRGDVLVGSQGDMLNLRSKGLAQECSLPELLSKTQSRCAQDRSGLCILPRRIREIASRIRKAASPWASFFLLHARARRRTLLDKIPRAMRSLSWASSFGLEVLFEGVPQVGTYRGQSKEVMPSMFSRFSYRLKTEDFLQPSMRRSSPLGANDRSGQFSFQVWNKLRKALSRNAPVGTGPGSSSMRHLCAADASSDPSHRRKPDQQSSLQPDRDLQIMPRDTPQIESDSVAMVRRLRANRVAVYDLQVEGTNNFFANEILVHNCLVMDDLIKNLQDAESELVQNEIFDIYKSVVKDRMRPGAKIVLCMHKWVENDIAGRILDLDGTVDEGGLWTVLRLPAEDPPGCDAYLWEEFYGKDHYREMKKDDVTWSGKFQQDPSTSRSFWFKEEWLNFYDHKEIHPGKFNTYIFVDPASSKEKNSDYTVINVIAAGPEKKNFLCDWVWDKLDPGERTNAIMRLCRKWNPKGLYYETYGKDSDAYYLKEKMLEDDFPESAYPIAVGRSGRTHNTAKHLRIANLVPQYREGKMFLPHKFERMQYDGNKIDYTQEFIRREYRLYRGKKSIAHEDNLDCQSRIVDSAVHMDYDKPLSEGAYPKQISYPGTSWYANY